MALSTFSHFHPVSSRSSSISFWPSIGVHFSMGVSEIGCSNILKNILKIWKTSLEGMENVSFILKTCFKSPWFPKSWGYPQLSSIDDIFPLPSENWLTGHGWCLFRSSQAMVRDSLEPPATTHSEHPKANHHFPEPKVTMVVSIPSHGHPWLGFFFGYPHNSGKPSVMKINHYITIM